MPRLTSGCRWPETCSPLRISATFNTYDDPDQRKVDFATVDINAFIHYAMSGEINGGHVKAVTYNFPAAVLGDDPAIVTYNTGIVANAKEIP